MSDADVIRRIRKTISLAENRANETESQTAWQKVHEMLRTHGLTLEEVMTGKRGKKNAKLHGRSTPLLTGLSSVFKRNKTVVIPWDEFFRIERDEMVTLQIVPDRTVQSGRAVESILNTIHSMYESLFDRMWSEGLTIVFKSKDFASYRVVYEAGRITFYLVVPSKYTKSIMHTLENVWPKAAIHPVHNPISDLDHEKTLCAYVELKEHYFKATLVDRTRSNPMPSLIASGRNLMEDDKAVLDVAFVPVSDTWRSRARSARNRYLKGVEVKKLPSKWTDFLFMLGDLLVDGIIEKFFGLFDIAFGAEPEKEDKGDIRLRRQLKPTTNQKFEHQGFNTVIRIASQSESKARADQTLRSIGTAFKDLTADNEFEIRRVEKSKPFVKQLVNNRVPIVTINANILSTPECSQIVQMPSAALQEEYPEVQAIKKTEVRVSGELFRDDVPGITIGEVTEKEVTRTAKIPLAPYTIANGDKEEKVRQKDVYDALCTPTFAFGKMGVGKTDGVGAGEALDMIKAGYTAFLLDTADGQVAKTLTDALPADYPDEKLIYLDYRNVNRAIPLTYSDIAETISRVGGDTELAELQMATRLTNHLQEFLNQQSATGQLTDRMRRYFVSAARATRGRPLHIELALTSPSYREELLQDPFILSQPDVVEDLLALQNKAESGADSQIIDPIIERLRMLSRNPFVANVFLSEDKRDEQGRLLLDFRRYADNPEGGYGYCVVIVCDKDTFGPEGQELICSTVQSKIFLACYSRIDQDQSERKPYISIADEPHRFIKGGAAARLYSDAAVELRKYRCRVLMLAHSPEQLGDVWDAFGSGGSQIIAYKSENMNDYRKISSQLAPYDAEYVYQNLPEKWEAVCKVRLPSGKESPAFFAKMTPPPKPVKDRTVRREQCGELFGYHWKEAMTKINALRRYYQELDSIWLAERENEEEERKQAEKERKAEEREARKQARKEKKDVH